MPQPPPLPFTNWQNFYVIAGSAAGALTGLQFVVIALITQTRSAGSMREIRAFGTPTVVHFCAALLLSALMVAPWQGPAAFSACLGVCGIAGVAYSLTIFRHAREASYDPDFEDTIWYIALPLTAHAATVAGAALLWWHPVWSAVVLAANTLLFLLLGIHNAWDSVTYIAVGRHENGAQERNPT